MAKSITAADTISASSAVTTLLRCPGIWDAYRLTREGEKPACWTVDRAAIAQCMADMIANEALGINDLGRQGEFASYPLQSFAQWYLGLDHPRALTELFPYWLKDIYRTSRDKAVFRRCFGEILGLAADGNGRGSPSAKGTCSAEEALSGIRHRLHLRRVGG